MLALLGLALAASAQPVSSPVAATQPTLESTVPWWERVAVLVDGKGAQQSCTIQSSLDPAGPKACDRAVAATMQMKGKGGPEGSYSRITFERRFSPAARLDSGRLQPGDTLLARQVMFLTIGANGSIEGCKVISTDGDMRLAYGCDEAKAEQFKASDSDRPEGARQAFMTILAYGHEEQIA